MTGLMNRDALDSDRGMLFVFPAPKQASFWMHNTSIPLDLAFLDANGVILEVASSDVSIRFEGTDGWVGSKGWQGRLEGSDVNVFRRTYDPVANKIWPRRPREHRDFLDSIKTGRPPMYTAEALHRLSTTLHLGAIAMELKRPLKWDQVGESFVDDNEANALRSRPQRDDWKRA